MARRTFLLAIMLGTRTYRAERSSEEDGMSLQVDGAEDEQVVRGANTVSTQSPKDIGLTWDIVSLGSYALTKFWTNPKEDILDQHAAMWTATYTGPTELPQEGAPRATGKCESCQINQQYLIKVFWRPMQGQEGAKDKVALPSNWMFVRMEKHYEGKEISDNIWGEAAAHAKESLSGAHSECDIAHKVWKKSKDKGGKISDCLLDHVGTVEDGMNAEKDFSQEMTLFTVHFYPSGSKRLGEFWLQTMDKVPVATHPLFFVTIVDQALESLVTVNSAGYVHRNIGADAFNVRFLDDALEVRLTNFNLALEEDATLERSTSNINAPPEWTEKVAFSETHPFTFDNYQLANLIMELLTGLSMLELVYKSWGWEKQTTEGFSDKASWCGTLVSEHTSSCEFLHSRAVFAFFAKEFTMDYKLISPMVENVAKRRMIKLKAKTLWDKLGNDYKTEFPAFMGVVGSMLQTKAEARPQNAEAVLGSDAYKAFYNAVVEKANAEVELTTKGPDPEVS